MAALSLAAQLVDAQLNLVVNRQIAETADLPLRELCRKKDMAYRYRLAVLEEKVSRRRQEVAA